MNDITAPRKVVINHCRKRHKRSRRPRRSPEKFYEALERIQEKAAENNGVLTSEQAWFIAEETWSFAMRFIDPRMATAFACQHISKPENFENMSDDERMNYLSAFAPIAGQLKDDSFLCAYVLSMGIRIATDALLASSPEIFQEG